MRRSWITSPGKAQKVFTFLFTIVKRQEVGSQDLRVCVRGGVAARAVVGACYRACHFSSAIVGPACRMTCARPRTRMSFWKLIRSAGDTKGAKPPCVDIPHRANLRK